MTQPTQTTGRGPRIAESEVFTLDAVLKLFASEGVLTPQQVETVRSNHAAIEQSLRSAYRSASIQNSYVSPLEILSAFDFPSHNPRLETADIVEFSQAFSFATGFPFARIDPLKLDAKALCSIVSKPFARKHLLVPVKIDGRKLTVAMVNPFDRLGIEGLSDATGFEIETVLGVRPEILRTINEVFAFEHSLQKAERLREESRDLGNLEQLVEMMTEEELDATDQHVVKAVDLLLQYAFEQRASDIHIEPKRDQTLVRLRIDGRLHDTHTIPKQVYPSFLSRLKIMARLDIAEKRKPQDGRIKSAFKEQEIELRVSTVPVAFGEKIVIRIFDPTILIQSIEELGFFAEQRVAYERLLGHPHGIILVTGPTGSGKTTTLYSSLQHIASSETNIVTIEDPIEMVHEPFNQIAVQESAGVTFANALRSVLRQDPDIIMIGEIRDVETAQYAVQASLTGHLVFSTLHTNTASSAITRLIDLGIESFLIASTVIGIVAQRLLRKVCPYCWEPDTISDDEMFLLGLGETEVDVSNIRRGKGCEKCRKTGYRGRTAAFETITVSERMRAQIRDGVDDRTLEKMARQAGMQSLMSAAQKKLLGGETTTEEILRVIPMTQ